MVRGAMKHMKGKSTTETLYSYSFIFNNNKIIQIYKEIMGFKPETTGIQVLLQNYWSTVSSHISVISFFPGAANASHSNTMYNDVTRSP